MDRRDFLQLSAFGLAGLAFSGIPALGRTRKGGKADGDYSMVVIGDTHYDTEPSSVYHSQYVDYSPKRGKVHRAEFVRNGEMWRERCPRLIDRAASLIREDTKMTLQMGDLIQGDCGNGDTHRKFLSDAMDYLKSKLSGVPFVTVVGNHDIRGTDAEAVYKDYMPRRMSAELGKEIPGTTFMFNVGDDAYLVLDFNTPDDDMVEKILADSAGARHTFVITHGPLFPMDNKSSRWFFHGRDKAKENEARLHFRAEFAKRNIICLCGHSHHTRLTEWKGDGGRITQMELSSVWADEDNGIYKIIEDNPKGYGFHRFDGTEDGMKSDEFTAIFDEYRPGITRYIDTVTAGSCLMRVSDRHVTLDFHAGDSADTTATFRLR